MGAAGGARGESRSSGQDEQTGAGGRPRGGESLVNTLGFIYYEMGRYDDAVVYLEKTLAADPKRKEAHGNIGYGYAHLKLGRRQDAKTHFER